MANNPVEANPVTRWLLGMAVILLMFLGAGGIGWLAGRTDLPFARPVGAAVGAAAVLVVVGAWYWRYHQRVTDEDGG